MCAALTHLPDEILVHLGAEGQARLLLFFSPL
jgi:hypothetical protein